MSTFASMEGLRLVRFVTYNIRHGELGLARVGDVLRELRPDVVFLQEVDVDCARSGRVDQAQRLADVLELSHLFAPAMPWDGGLYGIAILARGGLEPLATHHLPRTEPMLPDGHGEPRVVTLASWRDLVLACTHLGLDHRERVAQARVLRAHLPAGPLILGGDLNEGPEGPVAREWAGLLTDCFVEAGGVEVPSGPHDRPTARIDSIHRTSTAPRPVRAAIGPAGASDHRPVIVDFEEA